MPPFCSLQDNICARMHDFWWHKFAPEYFYSNAKQRMLRVEHCTVCMLHVHVYACVLQVLLWRVTKRLQTQWLCVVLMRWWRLLNFHSLSSSVQLLPLHSSVLKPNFHLSFSKTQPLADLPAFVASDVSSLCKLVLKVHILYARVRLPLLSSPSITRHTPNSWKINTKSSKSALKSQKSNFIWCFLQYF